MYPKRKSRDRNRRGISRNSEEREGVKERRTIRTKRAGKREREAINTKRRGIQEAIMVRVEAITITVMEWILTDIMICKSSGAAVRPTEKVQHWHDTQKTRLNIK